jgi:hypothetical protein
MNILFTLLSLGFLAGALYAFYKDNFKLATALTAGALGAFGWAAYQTTDFWIMTILFLIGTVTSFIAIGNYKVAGMNRQTVIAGIIAIAALVISSSLLLTSTPAVAAPLPPLDRLWQAGLVPPVALSAPALARPNFSSDAQTWRTCQQDFRLLHSQQPFYALPFWTRAGIGHLAVAVLHVALGYCFTLDQKLRRNLAFRLIPCRSGGDGSIYGISWYVNGSADAKAAAPVPPVASAPANVPPAAGAPEKEAPAQVPPQEPNSAPEPKPVATVINNSTDPRDHWVNPTPACKPINNLTGARLWNQQQNLHES